MGSLRRSLKMLRDFGSENVMEIGGPMTWTTVKQWWLTDTAFSNLSHPQLPSNRLPTRKEMIYRTNGKLFYPLQLHSSTQVTQTLIVKMDQAIDASVRVYSEAEHQIQQQLVYKNMTGWVL